MGKIKSKIVKKAAVKLVEKDLAFDKDFEKNKQMLKGTIPSKKVRNQLAGYLARIKKQKN